MTAAHSGLFILDKPADLTSHDVVNRLRQLTGVRRIGHAGTLDPLATGVLLLCLGRATRLLEYLTGQDKSYQTTIRLGQTTDTYDADGTVIAEAPWTDVTTADVAAALEPFRGLIEQVPPMYSALKKGGQPLYKLARKGIEVDRPARQVTIHALTLLDWQPPHLTLDIHCSSGTYIRSIANDLGTALGTGGHISALRRTAIGRFPVSESRPLAQLDESNWQTFLQPPDQAVAHFPAVHLTDQDVASLWHGKAIPTTLTTKPGTLARVYDEGGRFAGLAEMRIGVWRPHKMFPPVEA